MTTSTQRRPVVVRSVRALAEDVVSIDLVSADGRPLGRPSPGAHVDLVLRDDLIRQYSLCGDVNDTTTWRIAVLREQAGRGGSAFVHDSIRPGDELAVTGPRNNFPLEPAPGYLFIAGGIGITPLLSMMQTLGADGVPWRLLYGGRRRASMAFLQELTGYGDRVTVAPQDEVGLLDLATALEGLDPRARVYCCGPEPLITAVEQACRDAGRKPPSIELFTARLSDEPVHQDGDTAFDVDLVDSGRRIHIPADRTIVSVLEDEGVYIPTSCTEGYCGTCETEVVDGLPDHRDDYLSPAERATNDRMMVCVGRSKCPVLSLRL